MSATLTPTYPDRHPTTAHPPEAHAAAGAAGDGDLVRAVAQAALLRRGFYLVVLLVALAGQVSGARESLHLAPLQAIPAMSALELGGMVVLANADVRRRLGERAIGSRLLSASIAAGAVSFNAVGHHNHLTGGFFAGMSALGYLVWLTHSNNSRRDRLRARGDLPPTTPAYEVLGHWLRHPAVTLHARSLAKADPGLGLYRSWALAVENRAQQHRRDAIAAVLNRKIRAAVDKDTAAIAVAVYDLDRIAQHLADRADYDGLTALVAADLDPRRLAGTARRHASDPLGRQRPMAPDLYPVPTINLPVEDRPATPRSSPAGDQERLTPWPVIPPAVHPDGGDAVPSAVTSRKVSSPRSAPQEAGHCGPSGSTVDLADTSGPVGGGDPAFPGGVARVAEWSDDADDAGAVPSETAAAVAYWHRRDPDLHPRDIGVRIDRSERTVRRYWPPPSNRAEAAVNDSRPG